MVERRIEKIIEMPGNDISADKLGDVICDWIYRKKYYL